MQDFWLCFVPIFVAVDPLGVLPLFMALTAGRAPAEVRRMAAASSAAAWAVSLAFLAGGAHLLAALGVTVADFMVAGGTLLFVIALSDLVNGDKPRRQVELDGLGVVPLGVPLVAGPGVMAALVLLRNVYGFWPTALALTANMVLTWAMFRAADLVLGVLGRQGVRVVSKLAALVLAAFAVMLVRKGLTVFLAG